MFCHQCQETMRNQGCNAAKGVCGKTTDVANLQDLLLYVCKGIGFWASKALEKGIYDEDAAFFVDRMLFATITNANFSATEFTAWTLEALKCREAIKAAFLKAGGTAGGAAAGAAGGAAGGAVGEAAGAAADGAAGGTLPGAATWTVPDAAGVKAAAAAGLGGWLAIADEDRRSLESLVLYGLKGIAAYIEHAFMLGQSSKEVFVFMLGALSSLADENADKEALLALVIETGKQGVAAMALLDSANTGAYGKPRIATVKTGVRGRPGILVSGHDLRDLHDLLEQTKGTGVDVYTHGEMLPAHYYPFFEKYDNLYGNYGGSWWTQGKDIETFHGPVLFTSNCLVPPKEEQKARIFTTGVVGFDGCAHIDDRREGGMKDFSAIIALAKKCAAPQEIENGSIVGGFAHDQIFALADKVVDAVKSGAIKRFVVMAGCDARQSTRAYFTDVAKALPEGAVILTAGCAKYRYNKLPLGDIGGIPRVLDAGQCNDSYSLALVALKLKEIFGLDDVNKLPLSFDIAWYEQKAVLVLLSLLSLGFKNIRLGPTLPGFLSPAVAGTLVKVFGIKGIETADQDVAAMMAGR